MPFPLAHPASGGYRLGRPKGKVNGEKFKKNERGSGAGEFLSRARHGIEQRSQGREICPASQRKKGGAEGNRSAHPKARQEPCERNREIQRHPSAAGEKDNGASRRSHGDRRGNPHSGISHLGVAGTEWRRRGLGARLAGSPPPVAGRSRARLTTRSFRRSRRARCYRPETVSISGRQAFTFSIRRLIVKGFARKPRTRASLRSSCARSSDPWPLTRRSGGTVRGGLEFS